MESGPETDPHYPASSTSTLIEQVVVPASLFLNGNQDGNLSWDVGQATEGENGSLELIHSVWVPFSQVRTLTLGSAYNIRLVADSCDFRIHCMGRADGPSAGFSPSGQSVSTWPSWASTRSVSWNAWEDSRGCQVSSNSGTSWGYGPVAGRYSPILFKCVTAASVIVDNYNANNSGGSLASKTGIWVGSTAAPGYYGTGYEHDDNLGKGKTTPLHQTFLRREPTLFTCDGRRAPIVPRMFH